MDDLEIDVPLPYTCRVCGALTHKAILMTVNAGQYHLCKPCHGKRPRDESKRKAWAVSLFDKGPVWN